MIEKVILYLMFVNSTTVGYLGFGLTEAKGGGGPTANVTYVACKRDDLSFLGPHRGGGGASPPPPLYRLVFYDKHK